MAKSKEELKNLLLKADLELNNQKNYGHGIQYHHFMQIDGEVWRKGNTLALLVGM